jgi:Colicin V production protein
MLELILVAIFLLCVGFIFNEGLWGACILLFNVLLAATLAVNFFEPVANWLDSMAPSYTFLCDIVAIWVCFAAALVVLRLITGVLSRHRVRFKRPVDLAGGVFFSVWIGWIMVQFTLFSFHVAPLGRNFMGFQEKPDSRMFLNLAPDRNWLAYMHTLSKSGSLARTPPANDPNAYVFDPQGDFILKYGARRKQLEGMPGLRVATQ